VAVQVCYVVRSPVPVRLQNLAGVLDSMPRLSALTLHGCPLPEDQAETFGAALSRRSTLTAVRMCMCSLVDGSAQAVARHLRLLPALRTVSMAMNPINDRRAVREIIACSMATSWDLRATVNELLKR